MAKFEKVTAYKDVDFNLPTRKTSRSAGYDFEVAEDIIIPSYLQMTDAIATFVNRYETKDLKEMADFTKQHHFKPTLVPTGVKCKLEPDKYLELSVRSSAPLKHWLVLANSVGIVDADYYNSPYNEGHIYFQLINLSPFNIKLHKGDIIGQGIIKKYEIVEDDNASGERLGGFGSTSK